MHAHRYTFPQTRGPVFVVELTIVSEDSRKLSKDALREQLEGWKRLSPKYHFPPSGFAPPSETEGIQRSDTWLGNLPSPFLHAC